MQPCSSGIGDERDAERVARPLRIGGSKPIPGFVPI